MTDLSIDFKLVELSREKIQEVLTHSRASDAEVRSLQRFEAR
jgi:hypothetical protein